jgi:hypothetical protein
MADDPNGDRDFWSKVQKQELPHCGLCDPVTRHVERDDGRFERCPRCHPLQGALLPQTWRCPVCRALIYRDQRGLPCDRHRTIIGWRHAYDAARSDALPLASPVTEAGAKDARGQLAARPLPGWPAASIGAGLHGEALARAQAAESRAARPAELLPVPDPEPDPDDDPEPDDPDPDEPEEPPPDDDDDPDVPY